MSVSERIKRPIIMASASVLMITGVSFLASPSMVAAFVMPKLRIHDSPNALAVMSMTEDRTEKGKEIFNNGQLGKNGQKLPLPINLLNDDCEPEDTYEIHVGRALDTLRKDYPHILTEQPDFTIFDKELEVIDPSGVKLHGLKNYKNAFRLMHAIISVFYCPERSGLTYRLCYDTARQNIRVSWNAEVVPKALFGGVRTTLHVDGISVYEISRKSGMITQHRIERLVINDTPIRPQQGIFAKLRNEHDETVPAFNSLAPFLEEDVNDGNNPSPAPHNLGNILEFQQAQQSTLFSEVWNNDMPSSSTAIMAISRDENSDSSAANSLEHPGLDWEAYERKNASRQKFGLKPMTPEEYLENEAQIKQLDSQQRQRATSSSATAEMAKQTKTRQQGILEKLFGDILPQTCESNFDCERPEVCCDFGFKQICCASGAFVGSSQVYKPATVPVPVDIYPPGKEPQRF